MNKLSKAQRLDAKRRIAAAFGKRRHAAMNTSSEIGSSNFYGDDSMPKLTRTDVLELIDCAIYNWAEDENVTPEEWAESVISNIIDDIL